MQSTGPSQSPHHAGHKGPHGVKQVAAGLIDLQMGRLSVHGCVHSPSRTRLPDAWSLAGRVWRRMAVGGQAADYDRACKTISRM